MELNTITSEIIDSSIKIHKLYGPGLLESVYEQILVFELEQKKFFVEKQKLFPIYHEGHKIDLGFRIDIMVENKIIVELKAVEKIMPIHKAQILSYMKLTKTQIGLLINFNVPLLKDGIQRFSL
jgi:GxxExxY protein